MERTLPILSRRYRSEATFTRDDLAWLLAGLEDSTAILQRALLAMDRRRVSSVTLPVNEQTQAAAGMAEALAAFVFDLRDAANRAKRGEPQPAAPPLPMTDRWVLTDASDREANDPTPDEIARRAAEAAANRPENSGRARYGAKHYGPRKAVRP